MSTFDKNAVEESIRLKEASSGSVTVFTVKDVMASASYYSDKLGFAKAFEYGKPTYYVGLCSGAVQLPPAPREIKNGPRISAWPVSYQRVYGSVGGGSWA